MPRELASKRKDVKWSDSLPSGEDSANYNGGKYIDDKGYVRVLKTDHPRNIRGYAYEHRLVVEEYLGRYLEPWETVHHKNGNRQDIRIENLELYTSQTEHATLTLMERRIRELEKKPKYKVIRERIERTKKDIVRG
jgi:hypothetical protein